MSLSFFHFILSLPDNANFMIMRLKNEAKRIIGDYPSMNARAHITINNYPRKPLYINEQGFTMFERRLKLLPPIVFKIDGFDCFNEENNYNKTIYAKLKLSDQNKYWFKLLWKIVGKGSDTPHITIARNITPEQFNRLWPHFQKREMHEKFIVSRFTILRNRPSFEESRAVIYREFEFQGSQNTSIMPDNMGLTQSLKIYPSINQQISLF